MISLPLDLFNSSWSAIGYVVTFSLYLKITSLEKIMITFEARFTKQCGLFLFTREEKVSDMNVHGDSQSSK